MPLSLNWNELRTRKGSQNFAFEGLCCQLASKINMPTGSVFTRNDTPDDGVEGFWTLPDGSEHAWQAKFFQKRPEQTQWKEIEGSIKTALDKYKKLKKYFICLPIDRANPKLDEKTYFMDDWNKRRKKWENWANKKGMKVGFEYWGDHEIVTMLAEEKNRGFSYFWFNKEIFNQTWFNELFEKTRKTVEARYSPELNIELPITQSFEAFGQTEEFTNTIKKLISELIVKKTI